MLIKMFDEEHEQDLEDKVNDFIEDKEVIDIKYQLAVAMFSEDQIYCYSAMVLYKETC